MYIGKSIANFSAMARAYSLYPDKVPFLMTSSSSKEDMKYLWHYSFGRKFERGIKRWMPGALFNFSSWILSVEILRFNHVARSDLTRNASTLDDENKNEDGSRAYDQSVYEYLKRNKFSLEFQERYFLPLVCILYTITDRDDVFDLPVIHVLQRLWTLDLLRLPSSWGNWNVSRISGPNLPVDSIDVPFHSNCRVNSIKQDAKTGLFALHYECDEEKFSRDQGAEPRYEWDHIVLAVPGDVARDIMKDISSKEEDLILSHFTSDLVVAVLEKHPAQPAGSDGPSAATFNYATSPDLLDPSVMISYGYRQHRCKSNMTLHPFPSSENAPIVASVTLNLKSPPYDLSRIQTLWEYQQPRLTRQTLLAQKQLKKIQNTRGISYAGAWTETGNIGWHEDAARSGFRVAEDHLGARSWKKGVDFEAIRRKEEAIASQCVLPKEKGQDVLIKLGLALLLAGLQVLDFGLVAMAVLCGVWEGQGRMVGGERFAMYMEEWDDRAGRLKMRLSGKRSSHPSLSRKLN